MQRHSFGTLALGGFFILSTALLALSAYTLLVPGTAFDAIWKINPEGHRAVLDARHLIGGAFLFLCLVMAATAFGWFLRRPWAWRTALVLFTLNGIGDLIQVFRGNPIGGWFGVMVAALLVYYLTGDNVRRRFGEPRAEAEAE